MAAVFFLPIEAASLGFKDYLSKQQCVGKSRVRAISADSRLKSFGLAEAFGKVKPEQREWVNNQTLRMRGHELVESRKQTRLVDKVCPKGEISSISKFLLYCCTAKGQAVLILS